MSEYELWIVIYPGGDRAKLSIADIAGSEHERDDYALASREGFPNKVAADTYARALARQNFKHYVPPGGEHDYLD